MGRIIVMQKKNIRVGLLGFGSMGKVHAYAINNLPFYYANLPFQVKIEGVCTTDRKKAFSICEEFGFAIATDNEDDLIFSPDIDVIDICTPNCFHYETLKKAIAAGKHIYCEKPLCISATQAEEIAELSRANKERIGNIVFNNRFLAPILRAKQLIEEKRLGRILSFSARYLHSSALDPEKPIGWKQDREICGGGVLFDLGSHVIDLVYHLCGEFSSVCATTQTVYKKRVFVKGGLRHTDADEAFYMLAKLKNGATGTVSASKIAAGANDDLFLEIFGEKGSLRFSLMDPNFLYFYDNTETDAGAGGTKGYVAIECVGRYPSPGGGFPSPKAPSGWIRGHVESMYRFLNSVFSGTQGAPSFTDAAHVQQVMEASYRSAEAGVWVEVGGSL